MAVVAEGGGIRTPAKPVRPSWKDMKANYPLDKIDYLYETLLKGQFVGLSKLPAYQNTCAVRMSRALNYSGLILGVAPSKGGTVIAADKKKYWIRVLDLKRKLKEEFKGSDIPPLTLDVLSAKPSKKQLNARLKKADAFITSIKNKTGIVVFDVEGWKDAAGHFTLWDGSKLLYAPGYDSASTLDYYFWLYQTDGEKTVQTKSVTFWELI